MKTNSESRENSEPCLIATPLVFSKIKEFPEAFRRSTRVKGRHQTSHFWLETELAASACGSLTPVEARLAVVASKKAVDKRAVARNRAKRRLRPLMRDLARQTLLSLQAQSKAGDGRLRLNWVVRAHASGVTVAYEELRQDVAKTLERFCSGSEKGARPLHSSTASRPEPR